ncbi:putative zinc-binding metallopeptidase [Phycisphaerales bacterium AB-hyl4]|uniref:Zinc-binding metallopeptidase n=1 Tax=Natronomicrosphaera hydrolytica TaxID=3242702 RepID=A0ABV4U6F6_9BACT
MQIYACTCDNSLFFDNSQCLRCGKMAGLCPACRRIVPLEPRPDGGLRCGWDDCGVSLVRCYNSQQHNVCNWCIASDKTVAESGDLCRSCRFTQTIPDLSVPSHHVKWYRLEQAKRRLFYNLDILGLPYGTNADGFQPPLAFDFKADVTPAGEPWRSLGQAERVITGHANGRITINIAEADHVERERLRVDFGESHRTLIGHFRHEIGHYYWLMLIQNQREPDFKRVFGDPENPTYKDAIDRYYKHGPAPDWQHHFISAYASMHPWEDWAETFAGYLDMTALLDTARHVGFSSVYPDADFDTLVVEYQRLGIAVNELNRGVGLLDLVPDVLVTPVVEKMRFINQVCRTVALTPQ